MKNKYQKLISFFIVLTFVLAPVSPLGAAFNPNHIISDVEFEDYTSMTQAEIQRFLNKKKSPLADYVDPRTKISATQLIYDNAQLNRINPKVILVTLQKEQSLITDQSPSSNQLDWATGFGICDACSYSDPGVQKYRGLATQIDFAASSFRLFHDAPQDYGFRVGSTMIIDGQAVTIANPATHALYIYTPHLHGNKNFYRLYQDWFTTSYPDGSLLQDSESGGVFLIQNGTKRPFDSKVALVSRYNIDKVIEASPEDLDAYPDGPAIRYAQYSLLRSPRGTVYLIVGEEKRGIASREVFRRIGFNPEEIIDLEQEAINSIPEGEVITMRSAYPTGGLLQDPLSGGVWYVQDGLRYAIWSPEILKANYSRLTVEPASEVEIGTYRIGAPVRFIDGELVKAHDDPAVYVISNGFRRPIASEEAFLGLGYKWENIISTSEKALSLHPLGEPIDIEDEEIEAAS